MYKAVEKGLLRFIPPDSPIHRLDRLFSEFLSEEKSDVQLCKGGI